MNNVKSNEINWTKKSWITGNLPVLWYISKKGSDTKHHNNNYHYFKWNTLLSAGIETPNRWQWFMCAQNETNWRSQMHIQLRANFFFFKLDEYENGFEELFMKKFGWNANRFSLDEVKNSIGNSTFLLNVAFDQFDFIVIDAIKSTNCVSRATIPCIKCQLFSFFFCANNRNVCFFHEIEC